jgi:hypothetical protein
MAMTMRVPVMPVQVSVAHPPAVAVMVMVVVMPPMSVPAVMMVPMAMTMTDLFDHAVLNCSCGRRRLWQRRGGGCGRERGAGDEK